MEEFVKKRDLEGLKNYFTSCRESAGDEDLSSLLEVRLRERGLDIARGPDETIEENVRRHLEFALNVCKNGLCVKQTAVQTLQDMFEVSGIGRCERLFGILEENMVQFKQNSTDVLGVFSSYKLEKSGDDDEDNGKRRVSEFRTELQEREERQARKAVEESLLRNRSNGVEGSASPSPDYEMSDSTLAKLASILAPHWKKLAEAMEISDKRIQDLKGQTNKSPAKSSPT
ncbi:hypothetical protein TELCIR_01854 [Teladorsagia circumcincta]|uniref:Uncharacterized protein n=1 Tax=Teladorsagia circumcincta TaxID=45464 RepID=A0A2G9V0Q8_TELCI|nr:hypothetical protein TELCIR_01854 [Teladorsagia circumcincta]